MSQLDFLAWFKPKAPVSTEPEILTFEGQQVRLKRRAYQRTIRVHVKPDGRLQVTCGRRLPQREIERFLHDSWPWVLATLKKVQEQLSQFPPKEFRRGEKFPFLGEPRTLDFAPGERKRVHFAVREERLWCFVPSARWEERPWGLNPEPELRQSLRKFYEQQARDVLTSRVEVFSRQMQLYPRKLAFRCQRTRWGSCSARGLISLNWRLIAAPLAVIDYVVIHELAHLKFADHSANFWRLVEEFCPDYDDHRRWLKASHHQMDF